MKNLIKYTLASLLCLTAFSCNNDFLLQKSDITAASLSAIVISPDWGANDYPIYVQGAGNAKFNVIKTPDWLHINTLSGNFNNNVAIINCTATVRNDFSEISMHNDLMILGIDGIGKTQVPVAYITEGNPKIETEKTLTLSYNSGYPSSTPLVVKNTGQGILVFTIIEKPDWITFNPDISSSTNPPVNYTIALAPNSKYDYNLTSTINPTNPPDLTGRIVISSNDKNNSQTVINVQCDLGTPSLYCYINQLDFGRTETTKSIDISNQGLGLLTWKIDSIPAWLSVSDTSGILSPYSWESLSFTCNRSLMPNEQQSQTVYLSTNDMNNPSFPIKVTVTNFIAHPENVKAIEGTVADAWLDKSSDILFIVTSQPNRLLAYNTKTRTVDKTLSLSKAPTCLSLSEDRHSAVVGHGGLISYVDLDNFSVTKTIEIDNIAYDIELGKDGWCCYTETNVQWSYLYWVNLNTNEKSSFYGLFGGCILRKVPNQNYIFAAEVNLSSGIYIFDLDTRDKKYNIFMYIGSYWFSENGNNIFSGNGIYRTSSFYVDNYNYDIYSIGNFSPSPYQTFWIDHSAASHSIWILAASSDSDASREIQQYEDNDYTRVKTYYYDENYNGSIAQAKYVFANSNGSEVVAIKSNNSNAWAVEHIPVTQ